MVKKILASLGAIVSEAVDRGLVARNAVRHYPEAQSHAINGKRQTKGWARIYRRRGKFPPLWRTPGALAAIVDGRGLHWPTCLRASWLALG